MACVVDESDLSTAQPFCPANPSVHRGITDHLSRVYFTICNVEGLTQTGLCLFNSLLLCPPFLWELWSLSRPRSHFRFCSLSLALALALALSHTLCLRRQRIFLALPLSEFECGVDTVMHPIHLMQSHR